MSSNIVINELKKHFKCWIAKNNETKIEKHEFELNTISDLNQLLQIIDEYFPDVNHYKLFRGQKDNYGNKLHATYFRGLREFIENSQNYSKQEDTKIEETFEFLIAFRKFYSDVTSKFFELFEEILSVLSLVDFTNNGSITKTRQSFQNKNHSLIDMYEPLLQHYGLNTKWLDLTSDFFVAAQFASSHYPNKRKKGFFDALKSIHHNYNSSKYCYIYFFVFPQNDQSEFHGDIIKSRCQLIDLKLIRPEIATRPLQQQSFLITDKSFDNKIENSDINPQFYESAKIALDYFDQVFCVFKIKKSTLIKFVKKNGVNTLIPEPSIDVFFKVFWLIISRLNSSLFTPSNPNTQSWSKFFVNIDIISYKFKQNDFLKIDEGFFHYHLNKSKSLIKLKQNEFKKLRRKAESKIKYLDSSFYKLQNYFAKLDGQGRGKYYDAIEDSNNLLKELNIQINASKAILIQIDKNDSYKLSGQQLSDYKKAIAECINLQKLVIESLNDAKKINHKVERFSHMLKIYSISYNSYKPYYLNQLNKMSLVYTELIILINNLEIEFEKIINGLKIFLKEFIDNKDPNYNHMIPDGEKCMNLNNEIELEFSSLDLKNDLLKRMTENLSSTINSLAYFDSFLNSE